MMELKRIKIVYKDSRGRVSLRKHTDHDMFMIDVADDGVLTLTPMVAMPQYVSERIDEFIEEHGEGIRVTRLDQRYEEIMK